MDSVIFIEAEISSYEKTSNYLNELLKDTTNSNYIFAIKNYINPDNSSDVKKCPDEIQPKLSMLLNVYQITNSINEQNGLPKMSERFFLEEKIKTYGFIQNLLNKIIEQNRANNIESYLRNFINNQSLLDAHKYIELENVLNRYKNWLTSKVALEKN